jgi:TetR/AcrR family fatty acid metabolism transcriptional regulator
VSTSSTGRKNASQKKSKKRGPGRPPASERGEDKKKQILRAAVRVFAEKGYHGCRISDVADEAGVAYGLVYHYFGNKESLLRSIFEENWSIFATTIEHISASEEGTAAKLRGIIDFCIQAYEAVPTVVRVLVHEFGRSARLGDALDEPEVDRVFQALDEVFAKSAAAGELPKGTDPHELTIIFLGALESALASFVIRAKSIERDGRDDKAVRQRMRDSLISVFVDPLEHVE